MDETAWFAIAQVHGMAAGKDVGVEVGEVAVAEVFEEVD